MNERVRQLAKKSGFSLDSNGIYTAKLEHLPITENMEKFAELIVKECLSMLDKHYDAAVASDDIKQHFGVE